MQIQVRNWHRNPVFRFCPPLVSGILTAEYVELAPPILFLSLSLSSIIISLFETLSLQHRYRLFIIPGIAAHILLFSSGSLLLKQNKTSSRLEEGKENTVLVLVTATPQKGEKRWKAEATVQYYGSEKKEKILVYTSSGKIQCGDLVLIKKGLAPIPFSGNPGSFNYREYCRKNGISSQVFLEDEDYVLLKKGIVSPISSFINWSRKKIIDLLQKNLEKGEELGLAEALLIGYKADLNKDLLQSYSKTGVVHVIAISGLHLGLIYVILLLLTKPLQRAPLLRLVIILISLWTFSLIAGAGPSVLRSAIMFSFLALGTGTKRKGPVLNTLALSALLLLMTKPYLLWDAGFLLSYAAVLGILIFYRPLYALLNFKNKIVLNLWSLTALTLAAQIFTTPFTLFLFHKFPLLFLYANSITVPLSSLLLLGLLLLLPLSLIPPIAKPLSSLITWGIRLMNDFVRLIEEHPFSSWEPLQISLLQSVLLFITIPLLINYFLYRKKSNIYVSALFLFLFLISRLGLHYNAEQQHLLIVYSLSRKTGIEYIKGKSSIYIGDEAGDFYSKQAILDCRRINRVMKTEFVKGSFYTSDSLAGRLDKNATIPFPLRYLVISKGAQSSAITHPPSFLILDASLSFSSRKTWNAWAKKRAIPVHDVVEKGAFVVNLRPIPLRFL